MRVNDSFGSSRYVSFKITITHFLFTFEGLKIGIKHWDVFDSSSHYHYSFFADLINATLPNSFILKSENIREITCMALSQPLLVRFSFNFFFASSVFKSAMKLWNQKYVPKLAFSTVFLKEMHYKNQKLKNCELEKFPWKHLQYHHSVSRKNPWNSILELIHWFDEFFHRISQCGNFGNFPPLQFFFVKLIYSKTL